MFKIFKRIQFDPKDNRMKSIANIKSLEIYTIPLNQKTLNSCLINDFHG